MTLLFAATYGLYGFLTGGLIALASSPGGSKHDTIAAGLCFAVGTFIGAMGISA